jgi:hypothetical protein
MYPNIYFPSIKNNFKIKVKDGMEYHFREAIKSFDSNVKITSLSTFLMVETKVPESEIRGFTSVKSIQLLKEDQNGITFINNTAY